MTLGALMLAAAAALLALVVIAEVWVLGLPAAIAAGALTIGGVDTIRHARTLRRLRRAGEARRGYVHR